MIRPGDLLQNRYRIEAFLGRGGMADVYLALDTRRQVQVAIKVLREDLAEDPEFIHRFRREAEALARLDHPFIVRFYSFERHGALAFIVMDYVKGETLRRRIMQANGPLSLEESTSILRQVGSALQYAHNEGYIHRDIKPGNILIRDDGVALLSDFGIARVAETATMTMGVIGAPAYMSPEQIRGEEVSTQSDIYSLGIVLYEMVTGYRPFTGGKTTGTGSASKIQRIQQQHLHDDPPDPRRFNSVLPAGAAEVIRRALAKRPQDRWPNVMSLVRAWENTLGLRHERTLGGRIAPPWAETPIAPPAATPLSPTHSYSQNNLQSGRQPVREKSPWIAVGSVAIVAIIAILAFGIVSDKFKQIPTPFSTPSLRPMSSALTQPPEPNSIDVAAAAETTAEAMLTSTADIESNVETVVAQTAEAFAATVTQEALEAHRTATAAINLTATKQMRSFKATVTSQARSQATRDARSTATAQAKKRKPTSTPKPKEKFLSGSSGVRCFQPKIRQWEDSSAGGGEIAGIVYDINGNRFNRAQVHLYIKSSNWEQYLPIAPDGIYHHCCLSYSMGNINVVELTGPGIRTFQPVEFKIYDLNKDKVLVDFYQTPCK